MTTTIDLDDLEAKAKAATPGPWARYSAESLGVSCGDGSYEPICRVVRSVRGENAAFMESCSPDVILALIAEVKALRADSRRGERIDREAAADLTHKCGACGCTMFLDVTVPHHRPAGGVRGDYCPGSGLVVDREGER